MTKPIISIDWDHTFRNMHGLDLNILTLMCYANSKAIPVGLTTHRDIENTTLYTLYHWQHKKPDNDATALAAAINYWQEYFFQPLNLSFEFINARYQPNYVDKNYYASVLLPHEKLLAMEIKQNNLLDDRDKIKKLIQQYQTKEDSIVDNEFKGKQIYWLTQYYANKFNGTVYHIDDSREVCDSLSDEFNRLNSNTKLNIKTVYYQHVPFFYNEQCNALLNEMGLLNDWKTFLQNNCMPCEDTALYLSLCLLATQINFTDFNLLNHIKINLSEFAQHKLTLLITNLIDRIIQSNQPIHFYLNEWI